MINLPRHKYHVSVTCEDERKFDTWTWAESPEHASKKAKSLLPASCKAVQVYVEEINEDVHRPTPADDGEPPTA